MNWYKLSQAASPPPELYHGTSNSFKNFQTPTGVEKMDVTSGGVVYLTESYSDAKKYALADKKKRGSLHAYVHTVESKNAISYSDQREIQNLPKKKNRFVRGVWVALPSDCKIISTEEI